MLIPLSILLLSSLMPYLKMSFIQSFYFSFLLMILLIYYILMSKHPMSMFQLPSPLMMCPLMLLLELISFFSSSMSLSLSMLCNIYSSHILISILPSILLFFIYPLDLLVSMIQSYIFLLLLYLYMNEVYVLNLSSKS